MLSTEAPTVVTYGDAHSLARNARFALPCGGQLKILVEPIAGKQSVQWQALEHQLAARRACYRQTNITTGEWLCESTLDALPAATHNSLTSDLFVSYLGPTRKLLIIGANPTAECLADIATQLDFAVTVCDPNQDAALHWQQKTDIQYLPVYPDGVVTRDFADATSAVVAVSHDPRIDDMAMLEALSAETFYVGAMGSMATSKSRRQRLSELGIKPEQLQKLRAPIGLNIGSKTPMEIAISIAAELIEAYAG